MVLCTKTVLVRSPSRMSVLTRASSVRVVVFFVRANSLRTRTLRGTLKSKDEFSNVLLQARTPKTGNCRQVSGVWWIGITATSTIDILFSAYSKSFCVLSYWQSIYRYDDLLKLRDGKICCWIMILGDSSHYLFCMDRCELMPWFVIHPDQWTRVKKWVGKFQLLNIFFLTRYSVKEPWNNLERQTWSKRLPIHFTRNKEKSISLLSLRYRKAEWFMKKKINYRDYHMRLWAGWRLEESSKLWLVKATINDNVMTISPISKAISLKLLISLLMR